jgi:hypothetical protein
MLLRCGASIRSAPHRTILGQRRLHLCLMLMLQRLQMVTKSLVIPAQTGIHGKQLARIHLSSMPATVYP